MSHVGLVDTGKIQHGLICFEQGAVGLQQADELKCLVENGGGISVRCLTKLCSNCLRS